jgi:putative FmdB family regulatory protein
MPYYDYKCTKCNHEFEVQQSIHDSALESCEKCGGKLRKVYGSGAGVIFKGQGFYVTDSKKKADCPAKAGCGGECKAG